MCHRAHVMVWEQVSGEGSFPPPCEFSRSNAGLRLCGKQTVSVRLNLIVKAEPLTLPRHNPLSPMTTFVCWPSPYSIMLQYKSPAQSTHKNPYVKDHSIPICLPRSWRALWKCYMLSQLQVDIDHMRLSVTLTATHGPWCLLHWWWMGWMWADVLCLIWIFKRGQSCLGKLSVSTVLATPAWESEFGFPVPTGQAQQYASVTSTLGSQGQEDRWGFLPVILEEMVKDRVCKIKWRVIG